MAYSRTVGQDHPGLFVFVLDQSGSMASKWMGDPSQNAIKAEALSDILNGAIREIGARSQKGGKPVHRCDIGLIGYEGRNVTSLWGGKIANKDLVGIEEVTASALEEHSVKVKVPDGRGGFVESDQTLQFWLKPKTGGGTPMAEGLSKARGMVETWLNSDPNHSDSFPPVVIHITDGMPNDDQAARIEAEKVRGLATNDGNVLLINIHVPDGIGYPILYPASEADLPPNSAEAKLLFDMSSNLPAEMYESAVGAGLPVKPGCKLMIVNANADSVATLIQWGSSAGGQKQDGTG